MERDEGVDINDQIDQLLVDPKPIENSESKIGWMRMKQLKHELMKNLL